MASAPSEHDRARGGPALPDRPPEHNQGIKWLLLVPLAGVLIPWIYNTRDPEFIGMPFFYWYQLLWVPISVLVTIAVYRATRGRR